MEPVPPPTETGRALDEGIGERQIASFVPQLALTPGHHALALGAGGGELLLRIVAAHPGATGTGIAADRVALDRARRAAVELGLQDRVEFVEDDPATVSARADLVLCVGAAPAWGGRPEALQALRERVEPGGTVLFGDTIGNGCVGREDGGGGVSSASLEELAALASDAGFEVVSAELDVVEAQERPQLGETAAHVAWLVLRPR